MKILVENHETHITVEVQGKAFHVVNPTFFGALDELHAQVTQDMAEHVAVLDEITVMKQGSSGPSTTPDLNAILDGARKVFGDVLFHSRP